MKKQTYVTDPKEVYALELIKLQRCFLRTQKVRGHIAKVDSAAWKQIEYLRQFNFLLEQASMVGEALLSLGCAQDVKINN